MNNKVKAILFDCDDTLIKTRETVWQAHKIAAKKFYNLTLTDELIAQHWGEPYPTMLVNIYQHLDEYDHIHEQYLTIKRQYPIPGYEESVLVINELLDRLPVGIVTAATMELLKIDLFPLGFALDRLTLLQTADDTPVHKPDPKVFDPTLKKLAKKKIKPQEVLYVGDDIRDYQAAIGAGLQFIGIARTTPHSFTSVSTKIITSLTELLNLV